MAVEAPPCSVLPWDSNFFGIGVGRVEAERMTPDEAAAAVAWARANDIDCLYALVAAEHTPTIRAMESAGFEFADVRLTLERNLPAEAVEGRLRIREASSADAERLRALARVSHHNTRFYQDGRFDRARCDELYAIWVSKVLAEADGLVLVPEVNGIVSGYLALHDAASQTARIGLIAVAAEVQGRRVGEMLVADGLRRVYERGARRAVVVTQGRSARAVRFYEKCGFRTSACQFWYHRWLDR